MASDDKCGLVAKTKYSITRHFLRKHGNETEDIVHEVDTNEEIINEPIVEDHAASIEAVKTPVLHFTLEDLLESVNLQQYSELIQQEMIDLNMLVNLKPEQFMEMVKDIGIVAGKTA